MNRFALLTTALLVIVATGCGNTPTDLTGPGGGTLGGTVLDSDGDGFSDDVENNSNPGTDPFDPSDNPNNVRDTDGDGCSDYDELTLVGFCDNDPNTQTTVLDSDGDGFSDDMEINGVPGTDPFDATDNPNNVRDTDRDGCSDYDELNFSGFCDGDPNTPSSEAFNGFWLADGINEPGQFIVGPIGLLLEVSEGRAACVTQRRTVSCDNLEYGQPSISRPFTLNNGFILIEFTMEFPPCKYDNVSALDGEKLIEVSISGFEIPGTDGLVFDVVMERRFVFTNKTVLSTGTLEYISVTTQNRCGLP